MESFFATIKRELDLKKLPTREGRMQAIFELACHQKSPQYVKVVSGRKRVKHTRG
jgi:hypothetical protein